MTESQTHTTPQHLPSNWTPNANTPNQTLEEVAASIFGTSEIAKYPIADASTFSETRRTRAQLLRQIERLTRDVRVGLQVQDDGLPSRSILTEGLINDSRLGSAETNSELARLAGTQAAIRLTYKVIAERISDEIHSASEKRRSGFVGFIKSLLAVKSRTNPEPDRDSMAAQIFNDLKFESQLNLSYASRWLAQISGDTSSLINIYEQALNSKLNELGRPTIQNYAEAITSGTDLAALKHTVNVIVIHHCPPASRAAIVDIDAPYNTLCDAELALRSAKLLVDATQREDQCRKAELAWIDAYRLAFVVCKESTAALVHAIRNSEKVELQNPSDVTNHDAETELLLASLLDGTADEATVSKFAATIEDRRTIKTNAIDVTRNFAL